MVWAIIVLVCLLLLLILLLCIPLCVSLKAVAIDSIVCSFRITWLFGLINKDISLQKETALEKQIEDKKRSISRIPLSAMLDKSLSHKVFVLLKRLLSHTKIRRLVIDLRIGLDDPADTWLLAAASIWTTLFVHPPFPHTISIRPCFTDEFLIDGVASGKVQITPITMIAAIVRFAFSAPVLKLTAQLVQTRWKRNR